MFLEVRSLSKSYKEGLDRAVSRISFTQEEGQVLALVGESGCGKTTLLRMIAGLIEPDEGEILLQGEKVKGPEQKLVAGHDQIELVTQECELFEYLTVFDNVAHFIEIFDKEYRQQRVTELLTLCRIEEFAGRYPREMSGGQQQRLAIARALAKEPELLLLDEPFSHLDPHLKEAIMKDLGVVIKETGTTAIMVTHDTTDALRLADKILMMDAGVKVQEADPITTYHKPASYYVASLFSELNPISEFVLNIIQLDSCEGYKAYTRIEYWTVVPKNEQIIKAKVNRCFFLGSRFELECILEDGSLIHLFSNEAYKAGEEIGLWFDIHKVMWLD